MDIGTPEILLIAAIFAVVCGLVARSKGRNVLGWAALGIVFGPIALIILVLLRSRRLTDAPDAV